MPVLPSGSPPADPGILANPPPFSPSSDPTPTVRDILRQADADLIAPRQATTSAPAGFTAIPTTYGAQHSSPSPGTVVGIVLGSVFGFLLLLFLLYGCFDTGSPFGLFALFAPRDDVVLTVRETNVDEDARSHRKKRRKHRRRSPRETETYEVRTRERVVEEPGPAPRRASQPPPPQPMPMPMPMPMPPPPRRVVQESDTEEDEVIVYEEHDVPRRKSRRSSTRRSDDRRRSEDRRRRESGYREVDPDRFAGGDAPMRDMSRRRSSSRRPS